jgi:UDPglucose--hexose-1-phosphate uridylyltransferase
MSELRKDPVVDRWVIISEDETRTPSLDRKTEQIGEDGLCPFCPGNEHLCPPEILANRRFDSSPNDGQWNLRVLPNRSPLFVVEEEYKRMGEGLYDKITGVGANEVIIETRQHGIRQGKMAASELENLFWAYRDRIIDLGKDSRMRYVLIYKNCGPNAGATLVHAYSLLTAFPIVPRSILDEIDGAKKHFLYKERCIYCDVIRQEVQLETRVIRESDNFLAIEPFASRVPFETWVLPKRHAPRFENIEPMEISDLSELFRDILSRLDAGLNYPDYNYYIHTAPFGNDCDPFFHWHIEILPRLAPPTGLELGSEIYLNFTSPEEAAQFLRSLIV